MDNVYVFCGYFISIRFDLSGKVSYYVEVSKIEWEDIMSEMIIYCKNNDKKVSEHKVADLDDFLNVVYRIDDVEIGYISFSKYEDHI